MQARIKNPALVIPEAMPALLALSASAGKGGVPPLTLALVHQRVSQINGCSYCIHGGIHHAKKLGETDERLHAIAGWRDAPWFNEAERAALALAEAATRLSDRADPVPDDIWEEAARHYDEAGLSALVITIAATNAFNRINVTTRQVAGPVW